MKNNCTIYLLFSLIVLLSTEKVFGQVIDATKLTEEDKEWNDGTITLTSGETFTGLIKLNTKTGLLAYENGTTSKSFTPRSVLMFSYFDAALKQKRSFISVVYTADPSVKKKGKGSVSENGTPQFYEILIECKNFALLASTSRTNVKITQSGGGASYGAVGIGINNSSTTYSQTESLLIFDSDGMITPLLDIKQSETDQTLFGSSEKTKTKKLDSDAIEKYTAPHFDKLEEYARDQKLSFKRKDDLIKILDYYKLIAEQ